MATYRLLTSATTRTKDGHRLEIPAGQPVKLGDDEARNLERLGVIDGDGPSARAATAAREAAEKAAAEKAAKDSKKS